MLDDGEARRLLLDAAGRCIVRRGDTQIRMAEVAEEAGVVRSTVYRYFPARDDLVLGLVLMRIDAALDKLARSLRFPNDAAKCIPRMVLVPVDSVAGNPLNEALFATESAALSTVLELGSEQIVDVIGVHYGSLFERWQAAGQMYPDLDPRELARALRETRRRRENCSNAPPRPAIRAASATWPRSAAAPARRPARRVRANCCRRPRRPMPKRNISSG